MRSMIEAADLVDAAESFLRSLEPELDGRQAFHARVAANALAVVARELRQRPAEAELNALAVLLAGTPRGDLLAATCTKIRTGDWTADTPGLLDAIEAGIAARLAADNPKFPTLARLREMRT